MKYIQQHEVVVMDLVDWSTVGSITTNSPPNCTSLA